MKTRSSFKFVYALLIAILAFGAFAAPTAQAAPKGNTIIDVALAANAATGKFSILIQALQAADPSVIQTLNGNGQFTVFAPTDDVSISSLGELNISADELLSNQSLVTQVLLYHVARGNRDPATRVVAFLPTRTAVPPISLPRTSKSATVSSMSSIASFFLKGISLLTS